MMRIGDAHLSVVAFSSRRPVVVLLVSALIVALSVFSLSRVGIDSTLSGILGGENASAEAIARITDDFHSSEDLLLLVSASETLSVREAEGELLAYAARFAEAGSSAEGASAGITRVRYVPDASIEAYFREVAVPAGVLWLDDRSFEALIARLSPEEVRAQLTQNATLLAAPGPGAGALAKQLVQDPLRLREFFLSRVSTGRRDLSGAEFSDDGCGLLIRVSGARPVNDIEFAKRFTAAVRSLADRMNTSGLEVRMSGGYAVAATTATAIRKDAISSTIGCGILISLFLSIAYRRIFAPLTIVVSAGIGVVAAFGAYALFAPSITPLTAVLAAMLAGLGVDYAIHFRSHADECLSAGATPAVASIETARVLAGTLAAACVTSILGFGTVALSEVRMLKDFALLGCMGLAGALLSVWIVLPAILSIAGRKRRGATGSRRGLAPSNRPGGGFAKGTVARVVDHPRRSLGAGALVGVAAIMCILTTPGFAPPFESDPSALHPQPNPALEAGNEIRSRYRDLGESMFVRVTGDSVDEIAIRSHEVAARLATREARIAGVSDTLGLSLLVPDPRNVARRLQDLRSLDVERIVAGVEREIAESDFDPTAFDGYIEFLRELLTNTHVPGVAEVLDHPELARMLLPAASVDDPSTSPDQAVVLVRATNIASERGSRAGMVDRVRELLDDVPGATLTGLIVVSHDFELAARHDLKLFGTLSVSLVILWLLVLLRRPIDVILAAVPVLFSILCIFGVMSAMGEGLNPINVVAFPLLAGIAVDSGLFLVKAAKRSISDGIELRETMVPTIHAIMCTSVTTALGFGTLTWTHTPAVASLGMVMLVGVGSSLVASLLILVPLLVWRSVRIENHEPAIGLEGTPQ